MSTLEKTGEFLAYSILNLSAHSANEVFIVFWDMNTYPESSFPHSPLHAQCHLISYQLPKRGHNFLLQISWDRVILDR